MDSLTKRINRILQEEDIEGLIESGAPSDEYLSEAEGISLIASDMLEQDVETFEILIFQFWESIFNLSDEDMKLRRDALHRVAAQVIAAAGCSP